MSKPTAKLTAEQARDKFPKIVPAHAVASAELFGDHVAIVSMGRGAHVVMFNGNWSGCCPTRKHALRLADQFVAEVTRRLSGSVRV